MLLYLLKRLLAVIPTLWFITSVLFVLSKLIPGDSSHIYEDESMAGTTKAESREQTYRQFLKKTGQDLPVFYISMQTLAEPDTLYKILSARERAFLKQIIFHYGDWIAISSYYHHLQLLQTNLRQLPITPSIKTLFFKQSEALFSTYDAIQVMQLLDSLRNLSTQYLIESTLTQAIAGADKSFEMVVQQEKSYLNWIPVIKWNGWEDQYHRWLAGLLKGSLGFSLKDGRPISNIVGEAIGNTLVLSVCSILLIFALSIVISSFIIHEDYKIWRKFIMAFLYILDTIPVFLLALLLLIFLAASDSLMLFPLYGLGNIPTDAGWFETLLIQLYHLILPIICLTAASTPYVTAQLYEAMQEIQDLEYITTARAKGLRETRVVARHIFRNASLPLITLFSGFIPALVGGALVI